MRRYLIAAFGILFPVFAHAACPAIPANCPSPTFNSITLAVPVPFSSGGTGLTSGTSGGILGFTGVGTLASSVLLTNHAIVLGAGSGATPTPLGSLGSTTTVLHGNAAGAPTFGAVGLTVDVSGVLPVANGGTNLASGTSGGVLGYTATGTLAPSALLGANGLMIGGGSGATPTAITAGTNGQIPVGVSAGPPVMQTLSGDVSAVTSGGSVTVAKIGGVALSLGGTTALGAASSTVGAGTYFAGHSLVGIQTFCASGCNATGGTYTADAGTNEVIIQVQSAGGGSGGCGATNASNACISGSAASGSFMKALFTSSFSGITMTVGPAGAAGASGANAGGVGGTTSAGTLISCPGGTGGLAGVQSAPTAFNPVVGGVVGPSACTNTGGTVITGVAGQRSSGGFGVAITIAAQFPGQSGSTPIGEGVPALYSGGVATSPGTPGTGYGWGAAGAYSDASQAATAGLAGGPSLIVVYEFN